MTKNRALFSISLFIGLSCLFLATLAVQGNSVSPDYSQQAEPAPAQANAIQTPPPSNPPRIVVMPDEVTSTDSKGRQAPLVNIPADDGNTLYTRPLQPVPAQ